jgi:hypothetical protein
MERDGGRRRAAPPVTASELREVRNKLAETNHESYREIYRRLSRGLRETVAANPATTRYVFQVPSFLFGRPLFSHGRAMRYVYEKALRHGFKVDVLPGGLISLDWTPAPVPKKPLEIRRLQAEERAEEDAKKHLAERKERAAERKPIKNASRAKEAANAREAAENLNAHLEGLLKQLGRSSR